MAREEILFIFSGMSFYILKKIYDTSYRHFNFKITGKIFMKLISWNVNGIRAVYKKGLAEWIAKESPDILCLQETKADFDQFPSELTTLSGYQISYSSAVKKGYSGVSTFSREKILDTKKFEKESST